MKVVILNLWATQKSKTIQKHQLNICSNEKVFKITEQIKISVQKYVDFEQKNM